MTAPVNTVWMATPIAASTGKNKKPKAERKVLYPEFQLAAQTETDDFWREKLNNLSQGYPEKGFIFKSDSFMLVHRKGSKTAPFELSRNPYELASQIKQIYQGKGYFSDVVVQRQVADFDPEAGNSWSSLSKKTQTVVIDTYIKTLRDMYKLSRDQELSLRTTIVIGIILGYFGKNNINVKNNTVVGINGLVYDANEGFGISPGIKPKKTKAGTTKGGKAGMKKGKGVKDKIGIRVSPTGIISFTEDWIELLSSITEARKIPLHVTGLFTVIEKAKRGKKTVAAGAGSTLDNSTTAVIDASTTVAKDDNSDDD